MIRAAALALLLVAAAPAAAEIRQTSAGPVRITAEVTGLDTPWSLAFLPGGALLVTERAGRLLHVAPDGTRRAVAGLPELRVGGQGGLLDVMAPRDFAATREIFLTYAAPQGRRGAGTALARARLSEDGARLEDLRVLFALTEGSSGGRHFGSRVVEGADGHLYLTIGDRGDRPSAQDLGRENGTVVRLARDGSVPPDNPFAAGGGRPGIWSYGHRNPQGAALDAAGRLWTVEHGARGGDELNLIRRGANYGWPVISYGRHYSGLPIGEGTEKAGMEQPAVYWDPSIAPSGLVVYSGRLFPDWAGDFLTGSLNSDLIARVDGATLAEAERLATPETRRVRDIREAPDGALWFISEGNGTIYSLRPAPGG